MDLMGLLTGAFTDPLTYSVIFFTYVVLAAIILPIPVEVGLFNPNIHWTILVTILAIGKGVGSLLVFQIGATARKKIKKWSVRSSIISKFVEYAEMFVRKWGYYGLLIVLSTPLMIDSISLYLFSLLNPEEDGKRAMRRNWFVIINIIAGFIRGIITLGVAYYIGIRLV